MKFTESFLDEKENKYLTVQHNLPNFGLTLKVNLNMIKKISTA